MSCEKEFITQLRQQGFRMTPQREMVLAVLHEVEGFSSAEEIYQHVQQRSSAVDLSTVYRTLELLMEFEMVASVEGNDCQRRYSLMGLHGPHLHLVCQSCKEVTGVELENLQPLLQYLTEQYQFQLDTTNLSFPGLCKKCQ